jgi:branched-chain amino acid transport system ATP-binding protein
MKPKFLLLDEPAAGLNDAEAEELQRVVAGIAAKGECGVLLIEHRMPLIFSLCHRIQVLQHGATIAVGTPEEIRAHNAVRAAYLGDEAV